MSQLHSSQRGRNCNPDIPNSTRIFFQNVSVAFLTTRSQLQPRYTKCNWDFFLECPGCIPHNEVATATQMYQTQLRFFSGMSRLHSSQQGRNCNPNIPNATRIFFPECPSCIPHNEV